MRKRSYGERNRLGNLFQAMALDEKPIWKRLVGNFRDALSPQKRLSFEVPSTLIAQTDPMSVKTNPWAVGSSTIVNGGILALILFLSFHTTSHPGANPVSDGRVDISGLENLSRAMAALNHGGGGGGSNDVTDPIQGRTPKLELAPITPPQIPIIDHPKLAVDPAIAMPPDVKIPDTSTMPNIGVAHSPNVRLASNGQGTPSGIGSGSNDGDGPGHGPGWGPGADGGFGGEVYTPGGRISAPVPIFAPEEEFSDEARRQKYQGICLVALIVDAHGNPQNVHVLQRLGMGLDEKAMEAIRRYRFKPAMKDGKPVMAAITIEVNFRLF